MTTNADFKRRVRERMARTLHVTNGDITVDLLERSGITEPILAWRDALHEGPVVDGPQRLRLRAEFLGADVREFEARDRTLDAHAGDYVLWFEADLYDQLQIAEIVARLAHVDPARITLRQIGEHVGISHFGGLGQLEPEQLPGLPETPLTADALRLGRQAWTALTAPDPRGLLEIDRSPVLRFMREAFIRLAQEYPSRRDGLSLSERRLLAGTPGTRFELFERAWRKEARPFMGDSFAFDRLDRLAPLLHREGDVLRLNDDGARILAGEGDFVREVGVDRWIGGVHLTGGEWRWDEGTETLVYAPVRA